MCPYNIYINKLLAFSHALSLKMSLLLSVHNLVPHTARAILACEHRKLGGRIDLSALSCHYLALKHTSLSISLSDIMHVNLFLSCIFF